MLVLLLKGRFLMAISKVILNGVTLMDVTGDTVTSSRILSGYQATNNNGEKVIGTYIPSESGSFTIDVGLVATYISATETIAFS